jgi:hypothetical protein
MLTTLLSVLLMLFAIGYASAANYYVAVGGSGSGSSSGDPLGSIEAAVALCVSGADTIHVANGTYDSTSETFPITISNKTGIVIKGYGGTYHGPWIKGDNQNRVIEILESKNITIRNFKITDGFAGYVAGSDAGHGGGILVWGTSQSITSDDIMMYELEVTGNHAKGSGGGMAWHQSCGVIRDCCIWENLADGNADKEATDSGGGGIFLSWPAESATHEGYYVRDCCIFWNKATAYGGGIYLTGNDNHSEIVNNLIRQNCVRKAGEGAGIQSMCAKVYVKNNTVADNYHCDDRMPTWGSPDPQIDVYGIWGCDQDGYWMRMIHNIVYFNGPAAFDDINRDKITIHVMYSDVQMNAPWTPYPDWVTSPTDGYVNGNTNYDFDPHFVGEPDDARPCNSTFYFLDKSSPCIDKGIAAATDHWGQTHCDLVNTVTFGKDPKYSVHEDGSEDKDFWCDKMAHDEWRIDLGYHFDWSGMNYVELASFVAEAQRDKVVISWETGAEIDNAGFMVYRCDDVASNCHKVSGFIGAKGISASGAEYSFTDTNVAPGATYYYYLVDIDTSGVWTAHGPVSSTLPIAPSMLLDPHIARAR